LGIPVSLVGGWYDYYLPYMLEDYATLARAGSPVQLVVGPWPHRSFGGIAAGIRHGMDWLDAHLLGLRDRLGTARVRVAVMGGGWRELPSWPSTTTVTFWYLQPGGRLARSGPPDSPPDRYRYDPANPTPAVGGTTLSANSGLRDNRRLEARSDVLTYTTDPLEKDLEVAGPVV